ncbi:helix-turn-helix domain-containing protein [Winogradskya humida]|uniref:HTH cro/C1-type domain-containing protein n=1 Tax=Winogradskya humida TaxID=113566 RepID=A0ABQ4A1G7_9ACTN|nr:helix-turn-helix domain-containing protein [Actinoplanes humidus]GIE24678.1 hypothetical protein Ahu01nite_077800 [Actinoplanes humidus]
MNDELTPAQVGALVNKDDGYRETLVALLNERVGRWAWWDRSWRVTEIREVQDREINGWLHHVTISGVLGREAGETLPVSVFARVAGPHLDRFEVRVGDTVIGPPIRDSDPHPFGAIFSALMDRRGISRRDMARRCYLAESSVAKMRAGYLVPRRPDHLAALAAALDLSVGDLRAIAGLPEDD